jgi:hypothetical protein
MKKFIKDKSLPIFVLLLVALIALSVFAFVRFSSNKTQSNNTTISKRSSMRLDTNGKADSGEYMTKSSEQILSELKKAEIYVTDKISSSVLFENGLKGSNGSWVVENLASNNVIMQCEVFIGDKLFAKSVPIYPNEHIERIKLLNDLKSGSYDAIAYINYYKLGTKVYISKAGYKIKIVVQ